jgi:hypothetical protein
METQWFPASKEVQGIEVIKQGFGVCLLEQRWNFACRLPGKGYNHQAEYYVELLDKLKRSGVVSGSTVRHIINSEAFPHLSKKNIKFSAILRFHVSNKSSNLLLDSPK